MRAASEGLAGSKQAKALPSARLARGERGAGGHLAGGWRVAGVQRKSGRADESGWRVASERLARGWRATDEVQASG